MKQALTCSVGWEKPPADIGVFQVLPAAILTVLANLALVALGFRRTGKQQLTVPLFNTLALETWILIEAGRWPRLEGARSETDIAT